MAPFPQLVRKFGVLGCAVCIVASCGQTQGSAVVTNAPVPTPTPTASSSSVRTVLTSLGLHLHSGPSLSASVITTLPQGTQGTVIGVNASAGGWAEISGTFGKGWIVTDPTLSSPNVMQTYASSSPAFTALYRGGWTYQANTTSVVFNSPDGSQSITVTQFQSTPPSPSATAVSSKAIQVCGTTVQEVVTQNGSTDDSEVTLPETGGAVLQLSYSAPAGSDPSAFADFYNSLVYPGNGCSLAGLP